jgi:hypothetical protein
VDDAVRDAAEVAAALVVRPAVADHDDVRALRLRHRAEDLDRIPASSRAIVVTAGNRLESSLR